MFALVFARKGMTPLRKTSFEVFRLYFEPVPQNMFSIDAYRFPPSGKREKAKHTRQHRGQHAAGLSKHRRKGGTGDKQKLHGTQNDLLPMQINLLPM